jgi:hypothetical protein
LKKKYPQSNRASREEGIERREGLLDLKIGIGAEQLQGNGKRKRNAILAEFFEGDFRDLSKTVTIEKIGDGVAHIEHEKTEAAVILVGEPHYLSRIPDTGGDASAAPSPHEVTIAESRRNLELTHFTKGKS